MFVIPENLPSQLLPIAWLIGRWEGTGVVEYPTVPLHRFRQEIEFANDGRPFLHYTSRTWSLTDPTEADQAEQQAETLLTTETGYWRVVPSPEEAPRIVDVEIVLAHPTGIAEVYVGTAGEGKVDVATDVVARTATAPEYSAGKRLYGHVNGALMWAYDLAAEGQPMASHSSAQLQRVADDADAADAAEQDATAPEEN